MYVFGDPELTVPGVWGGLVTWVKVIGLFSILGWVVSWVALALKERNVAKGNWLDFAAVGALVGVVGAIILRVVEASGGTERVFKVGGVPVVTIILGISGAIAFLWIEAALWSTIRRRGRIGDLLVLLGIHIAFIPAFWLAHEVRLMSDAMPLPEGQRRMTWNDEVVYGARYAATFMGYVVLLRVVGLMLGELIAIRWRRLYSIARLTVIEANRRMWAPWVVLSVFLVILAFTHWFLQPPRPAEMGRLFVGTLALLCSLLLTVMVTILTPLSLPTDIQQQTIYTVVSKPVRRIELIWGRMLGFMTIVTVLVLVFGGMSLLYLRRQIYNGTIVPTETRAKELADNNHPTQAKHLREEADQLRARMSAREPIVGSLSFLDSRGTPHRLGIDVGQEQSMRQPRSHIEGATPATAIWNYGIVPDPFHPQIPVDRRIPVDRLLTPDSIEGLLNHVDELRARIAAAKRRQATERLSPDASQRLAASITRNTEELKAAEGAFRKREDEGKELESKAKDAEKAGRATEAETLRRQALALHSPAIPIEMTFNVYRTTKGKIGEPVLAEIEVTNPVVPRTPYRNIFPIREYYTNKHYIPASVLAGSQGALRIEIRCLSRTQYLGMAESDLYILARAGDFGTNYMKGLFGVWLQAMVLTAIGVFAGTFLSWPVALLTTISFFVAGQVAYNFLIDFSRQALLGGGPFESLVRLLTHDNQMSDLAPTLAVVTAKTFDSIVMPVMSRLVYVVPNFAVLDVSNVVADGFEVRWSLLGINLLLALAYALPFSIAGYFILKNREVAA
jgi:ABC-type transport system involved in multi-copper enzyme maturation permease subunit